MPTIRGVSLSPRRSDEETPDKSKRNSKLTFLRREPVDICPINLHNNISRLHLEW